MGGRKLELSLVMAHLGSASHTVAKSNGQGRAGANPIPPVLTAGGQLPHK
jgi:hypothetical protein